MSLRFEWDPRKATSNARKHRVTFEEAATVFGDPLSLEIEIPATSGKERRYVIVGRSLRDRLLVVVHTDRDDTIRVISARRATRRERRDYEDGL